MNPDELEMDPAGALQILAEMSRRAMGNAADHMMTAKAIDVLSGIVTPQIPDSVPSEETAE